MGGNRIEKKNDWNFCKEIGEDGDRGYHNGVWTVRLSNLFAQVLCWNNVPPFPDRKVDDLPILNRRRIKGFV